MRTPRRLNPPSPWRRCSGKQNSPFSVGWRAAKSRNETAGPAFSTSTSRTESPVSECRDCASALPINRSGIAGESEARATILAAGVGALVDGNGRTNVSALGQLNPEISMFAPAFISVTDQRRKAGPHFTRLGLANLDRQQTVANYFHLVERCRSQAGHFPGAVVRPFPLTALFDRLTFMTPNSFNQNV